MMSYSLVSLIIVGCSSAELAATKTIEKIERQRTEAETADGNEKSIGGKNSAANQKSQQKVAGGQPPADKQGQQGAANGMMQPAQKPPADMQNKPAANLPIMGVAQPKMEMPVVNKSSAAAPKGEVGAAQIANQEAAAAQQALDRETAEFRQRVQFVDLTYKICLGRAPESGALVFWSNQIATKQKTFAQIDAAICQSTEGQISQLYRDVLARFPDAEGMKSWHDWFTNGKITMPGIREALFTSVERQTMVNFEQKLTNLKTQIAALDKERSDVLLGLK